MKAEEAEEIRKEFLPAQQQQEGLLQTGRRRGGSVSNTSCRQAQGGSGKEEQPSGEPQLVFTLLVPVVSLNLRGTEMMPNACFPLFLDPLTAL